MFAHLEDAQARVGQGGGDTVERRHRQKPPDHEVGNTVRNDRGFVDVGIGTHKRHKRCRGDSERTQQGTCGQKTRSGVRASRWPTLPRQQSALKCTAWAQASAWAPARAGTGGSRKGACRGTALLMTGTSGGDKTLQVGERHAQSGRVGLDAVPSLFVPRAGVAHVSAHATERHGAPRGGVYVCGGIFSKNTGALIQAGCGGARGELRVRWLRR